MNEKVLNGKKNGMSVLLLVILAYIIGIAAIVCSGISLEQAPNAMNIAGLVVHTCVSRSASMEISN